MFLYLRMRIFILLFGIGFSTSCFAQVFPYQDLFFWSQKDFLANKIVQLDGYEFDYFEDSLIVDSTIFLGIHQTEEYFDSLGRITQKTNHYAYSDVLLKKRLISYHTYGNVKSYFHYSKDSLERAELYEWENGKLDQWKISVPTPYGLKNYSKEITRNPNGQETIESLKIGKKTLAKDTIIYYKTKDYISRVKKHLPSMEVADSIIEYTATGDTTLKKDIYEEGVLVYRALNWGTENEQTQRIKEYKDDLFYKVYYRILQDQKVVVERQIHSIPNLNFEKYYYYSEVGIPQKKEIYKNSKKPISTVYYVVKTKD